MFIAMLIIFLSAISKVSAQDFACDPTKAQAEMMACLQSQPNIFPLLPQLQSDPATAFEIACNHQQPLVELMDCVISKGISCMPKDEFFTDLIPAKENWKNGLEFLCKNKAEIIGNNCLKTLPDEFSKCMMMKNFEEFKGAQNMTSLEARNQVYCRVFDVKPCIQSSKGSCTESTLSIISQMVEKIFPLDKCQASKSDLSSKDAASSLSISIMGCYGLGLIVLWLFYPFY